MTATAAPHVSTAATGHHLLGAASFRVLAGLAALGTGALGLGLIVAPERAWPNLLLDNFYLLSVSLVGVFFIAIHRLAKAGWPTVLQRVPEAMTAYVPVGAVLMLVMLMGVPTLYHWSHPEAVAADALLQAKAGWLNVPAFAMRLVVVVALWWWLGRRIVRVSRRQDESGAIAETAAGMRASAVFTVVFALTFTIASIDWIMSLEPHWFSTLFPWYVFSSVACGGVALLTALLILLRRRGYLTATNEHHVHDLGKWVFAFSLFWGYLWFSQYMLIWYANIPEESVYYVARSEGGWWALFVANPIINVALPLLLLLPAAWKRNETLLFWVCVVIVAGHWLDLYIMVMPSATPAGPRIGPLEVAAVVGLGSLFLVLFDRAFRRAPMYPRGDPYFEESVHHHG